MRKPFSCVLLLILFFCAKGSFAQLPVLPVIRDSIYSDILKEVRTIEIVLPEHYSSPAGEKPGVIYVIDGEWNTGIVSNFNQFLNIQFTPPNIVVGIDAVPKGKENMRFRDLTPTKDNNPAFSQTGGADLFLSFIKNELMPYINKKYTNNGRNTIFGASLGGLFGMYALLKEPNLFNSCLLADPSLFWDHYMMQKLAAEKLNSLGDRDRVLFITGREGNPFKGMGIVGMDSVLRINAPKKLHWKSLAYNDETHNSMIFRTMYDGLKFIYQGYYASKSMGFYPSHGYLLKDKPINVHCFTDDFSDLRYTTNGAVPDSTSRVLPDNPISIMAPATFTVRSFCTQPVFEKSISGKFELTEPFKPVANRWGAPGGLNFSYFSSVDSLADFKKLKPVTTGIADSAFTLNNSPLNENFTCVLEGYLEVKKDGYYFFSIDSDGGLRFSIGGHLVIGPGQNSGRSIIVPLLKGFYPVQLAYFHHQGEKVLKFSCQGPENLDRYNVSPVPLALLYHSVR
jgi:predicted alpha/beta superfamily hydrolase